MTWALVTGSAKGLGKAIAVALAREGKSIAIHYKTSKKEAEELARTICRMGVDSRCFYGDFSSREGLLQFCQNFSFPIEILINNVGPYLNQTTLNTSVEEFQMLYQTNVFSPFLLMRELSGLQSVINMGFPDIESVRAKPKASCYAMAKQTLLTLTKSLARELREKGVRINMISPGYLENSADLPEGQRTIPFAEVVEMVCYLCSEKGKSITGQNITIAKGIGL